MNERGCPCADYATARTDRNRGRKIPARYPPVFRPEGESKVEGGKSRQAKLKLTSSVVSDPVAEQVQKGPEYCPGLIVLSKDR